jgi:hypothetical protein
MIRDLTACQTESAGQAALPTLIPKAALYRTTVSATVNLPITTLSVQRSDLSAKYAHTT